MTPSTPLQAGELATPDHTGLRQHGAPATAAPPTPRRLHSQGLFAGATEIEIEHQQQVYRLRKTALGKLILTK